MGASNLEHEEMNEAVMSPERWWEGLARRRALLHRRYGGKGRPCDVPNVGARRQINKRISESRSEDFA